MSTLKGLIIIVTMLVGGSSLAMALSESAPGKTPTAASGTSTRPALQHLAQRGGIKHSGSASNTEARQHKGQYKPGQ